MRKLFVTVLLLVVGFTTQAQEELTWHTDIKKAIEISNKEQKPMFLFFTGSDWCGWCIRLQNEVFRTPEFTKWAKEKVVLVELDYPRKMPQRDEIKSQNAMMQQVFQVQGYPTVWMVKPNIVDGKQNFEQLGKTGYVAGGPVTWIDGANKILANYVPDAKPEVAVKKTTTKSKKTTKKNA